MKIKTYWIHDQFALKPENKESMVLLENNWITLAIDAPIHIIKSLHQDCELVSQSVKTKVDYLLITHTDNDHIGWLANLIRCKVFAEWKKLNLITHENIYKDLWEYLKRIWFWFDRTKKELKENDMSDYCNFLPIWYDDKLNIPWFWSIKTFKRPTYHQEWMDVLAFQVNDEQNNNKANFSSDTSYDNELIDFLFENNGKVIHEIGSYTKKSHSHTDINELIFWVPNTEHDRLFVNHIPEIREEEIMQTIKNYNSLIRFASNI